MEPDLEALRQEVDESGASLPPMEEWVYEGETNASLQFNNPIAPATISSSLFAVGRTVAPSHSQAIGYGVITSATRMSSTALTATFSASAIGLTLAISAVQCVWEVGRYWRGEISKERLIKNVISTSSASAASLGGLFAGAAIGASIGTVCFAGIGTVVGTILGAIFGSVVAAVLTQSVVSSCLDKYWDTTEVEEALERRNMYLRSLKAFGANERTSDEKLALLKKKWMYRYHPDRAPNNRLKQKHTKLFISFVAHYEIIKLYREEVLSVGELRMHNCGDMVERTGIAILED